MPPGTASVESRRDKNYLGDIISLKPRNARAAAFWVHIEDEWPGIDVSFGFGTTMEFNDTSFEALVALVKQLASAVIAGRCEERFGFLAIRGVIRVDPVKGYWATHFFLPTLDSENGSLRALHTGARIGVFRQRAASALRE